MRIGYLPGCQRSCIGVLPTVTSPSVTLAPGGEVLRRREPITIAGAGSGVAIIAGVAFAAMDGGWLAIALRPFLNLSKNPKYQVPMAASSSTSPIAVRSGIRLFDCSAAARAARRVLGEGTSRRCAMSETLCGR